MSGFRSGDLLPAALFVLAGTSAAPAFATVYLSAEAAQRAVFPDAQSFQEVQIALTDAQRAAIDSAAGPQAPHGRLRAWAARVDDKVIGHVFIDEVVGRQDFIT